MSTPPTNGPPTSLLNLDLRPSGSPIQIRLIYCKVEQNRTGDVVAPLARRDHRKSKKNPQRAPRGLHPWRKFTKSRADRRAAAMRQFSTDQVYSRV